MLFRQKLEITTATLLLKTYQITYAIFFNERGCFVVAAHMMEF